MLKLNEYFKTLSAVSNSSMQNIQRRFIFSLGIVVLVGMSLSCTGKIAQREDNYYRVRSLAEPYTFDFVSWEAQAIYSLLGEKIFGQSGSDQETRLRSQIETVLVENGISVLPPLNFRLEKPPHLLVVSSREKIFYLDRVLLRQNLSDDAIEKLETQVDNLGLSSLVEGLGGLGATYPPIIDSNASLTFMVDTAVEEWLHQYLVFRPLGLLYLLDSLGIRQDRDVIIMNETLAGMVSDEIGSQVYARYYGAAEGVKPDRKRSGFDFRAEMRLTRKNVDQYLSQGDIEEAERYMEERRQVFLSNGYKIRKLNQAYFAFHGIYGGSPASVSPIHGELKLLRTKSSSLKDFLQKTSEMTSYTDLVKALQE
jgi:hypothetical protein